MSGRFWKMLRRSPSGLSLSAKVVLGYFVANPETELTTFGLIRVMGIPPGDAYPVVRELMESRKLLLVGRMLPEQGEGGTPPRLYRLDPDRVDEARALLNWKPGQDGEARP